MLTKPTDLLRFEVLMWVNMKITI